MKLLRCALVIRELAASLQFSCSTLVSSWASVICDSPSGIVSLHSFRDVWLSSQLECIVWEQQCASSSWDIYWYLWFTWTRMLRTGSIFWSVALSMWIHGWESTGLKWRAQIVLLSRSRIYLVITQWPGKCVQTLGRTHRFGSRLRNNSGIWVIPRWLPLCDE